MRNVLLTIIISLSLISVVKGQEVVEKKYLRNKFGGLTTEGKAKFIELSIKEKSGLLRIETRKIKNNRLIRLECYKDGFPTGIWKTLNREELNYDFELSYVSEKYDNVIHYDIDKRKLLGVVEGKFVPPLLNGDENGFSSLILKSLKYPDACLENGVQGKVESQFILDEYGKIIKLSILRGADKLLDKEVARCIKKSSAWSPASIDGKPIKVCIILTTNFCLQ